VFVQFDIAFGNAEYHIIGHLRNLLSFLALKTILHQPFPYKFLRELFLGFAFFLAASPALAYREARMFQLMWNNIGVSHMARFRTDLRTSAFVWLRIRNILLSMITGGFYRPFARVAEYRMKTESVTLHVRGGLEPLVGALEQEQQRGGFGDAVADALGLDMIG